MLRRSIAAVLAGLLLAVLLSVLLCVLRRFVLLSRGERRLAHRLFRRLRMLFGFFRRRLARVSVASRMLPYSLTWQAVQERARARTA